MMCKRVSRDQLVCASLQNDRQENCSPRTCFPSGFRVSKFRLLFHHQLRIPCIQIPDGAPPNFFCPNSVGLVLLPRLSRRGGYDSPSNTEDADGVVLNDTPV